MFSAVTNRLFERHHTLIKLLSITQNDEVKPECFCKFILKKGEVKAPLAAVRASSLLGFDCTNVNFKAMTFSLGFLGTENL